MSGGQDKDPVYEPEEIRVTPEWRKVVGFVDYEVSSLGELRSWKPYRNFAPKPTSPRPGWVGRDKDGYRKTRLYRDGVVTDARICRLVAEAFHGLPQPNQQVRHLDGTKDNDAACNLAWGTAAENSMDRTKHGTQVRGHDVNTSKLTEEAVTRILESNESAATLADEFDVNVSTIYHIRRGHTWKWLPAREKQTGGAHYRDMKIQPSEFIVQNNLGWHEGNAIKYLCRWKSKDGVKDLQKALHYVQLLIESQEQEYEEKS